MVCAFSSLLVVDDDVGDWLREEILGLSFVSFFFFFLQGF